MSKSEPKRGRGRPKTVGLRIIQIRVLATLTKTGNLDGLTMKQLETKTGLVKVVCHRALGAVNPDLREAHDKRNGFRSLLSLGMVRVEVHDGVNFFVPSPFGIRTYEKLPPEQKKLPPKHAAPYSRNPKKKPN